MIKKYLYLLFLIAAFIQLDAQTRHISNTSYTENDMIEYTVRLQHSVSASIYTAVAGNTLTAYKDYRLQNKLSAGDFKILGATKEIITIPNPNAESPTEFIDTALLEYVDPEEVLGFDMSNRENVFILNINATQNAFFKLAEVLAILNSEQKAYISYIKTNNMWTVPTAGLDSFCRKQFSSFCLQMYYSAINGSIPAYTNHKLDKTYTLEGIKEKGSMYYSPQLLTYAPEDTNAYKDTTIVTPFNPASINEIMIYHVWNTDENQATSISLYAMAPLYAPVAGGVLLPYQPICLLKAGDVLKSHPQETDFYNYFFMAVTRHKGTYKYHYSDIFQLSEGW